MVVVVLVVILFGVYVILLLFFVGGGEVLVSWEVVLFLFGFVELVWVGY